MSRTEREKIDRNEDAECGLDIAIGGSYDEPSCHKDWEQLPSADLLSFPIFFGGGLTLVLSNAAGS